MPIRTIIFDLGRVIVPFDFQRGYQALSSLCTYPVEEVPVRIRSTGLVEKFECGQIEPQNFVEQLSAALDIRPGYEEFCRIWSSVFLPETLVPESFIVALKQNYPVLLLSNTNAIHFEMIRENYPILGHFDDFILSYQVGAMKPSPLIYQAAIRRAGHAAEDCFFTDDIRTYVDGAKQQGIQAVLFEGYEKLKADMTALGIRF